MCFQVAVKGGTASIGRAWEGTPWYGWDNEFGQVLHKELVDFSVSQMLVSNAEYNQAPQPTRLACI